MMTWVKFGAAALVLVLIVAGAWLWTPDLTRQEAERRQGGAPSAFVEVLGLRLHLRDTGPRDAPPILLLHGFGSSLHTWDDWARLLETDRRVLRIDLPGFGLTGPDPSGDYSDQRFVLLVEELLDRLGIARIDILGSSMGGRLAWRFAADRPARVRRLVLMAPDGFASAGFRYGVPTPVPLAMRALPYTLPGFLLRGGLAPAYADAAALTDAVLARYRDMMLAPGVRHAIIARMEQHILEPPEPFLRRITAPVLLLWGESDRMIPAPHAADYARELPDSRTVLLPALGHVPMEEDPARSLAPVREFLATP